MTSESAACCAATRSDQPDWPCASARVVLLFGAGLYPHPAARLSTDASPLPADEHRDLRVREDLGRLAAEQQRADAAASVRGHDNQVAALLRRDLDDLLPRTIARPMERVAGDPRFACRLLPPQHPRNLLFYLRLILARAQDDLGRKHLGRIELRRRVQRRHPGVEGFR